MNEEEIEEIKSDSPSEPQEEVQPSEQDLLQTELENVQKKGKTKAEKLIYTRNRVNEQLKELGIEDEPEDDDDQPITRGEFKRLQEQQSTKTALQMADETTGDAERELLKYHLENTIRSTGNPREDFKLAQQLVNSVKNAQITEEVLRKPAAKTHSSGGGAPAKTSKAAEFTDEELSYMRAPFNMTAEQILAVRPK